MRLATTGYFLALLIAAAPAAAQDVRVLQDRIQRLEGELVQLQRQVYRGGAVAVAPAPGGAVAGDPSAIGNLLVRMDELEGQIRSLTGRVEQNEFRNQQLQQRLDKLVADVDYRLGALEKGGSPDGSAPAQQRGAAPVTGVPQSAAQASSPSQSNTLPPGWVVGPGAPPGTLGAPGQPGPQQQAAAAPPAAAKPAGKLPAGSTQDRYNYAVNLLQQGNYPEAEQALTEFVGAHPKDPLAANAQYWIGETYFARNQFDRSAQAFLATYQKYPKSPKAPDSLLKLSMSLTSLNQKQEACAVLKQLSAEFPKADATVKQAATRENQRAGCK